MLSERMVVFGSLGANRLDELVDQPTFVGVVAQCLGMAVLAMLLAGLARSARNPACLRAFAWSNALVSVATLAVALRYALLEIEQPLSWAAERSTTARVLYTVYLSSKLGALIFLLSGLRIFAGEVPPRRVIRFALGATLLFAIGAAWAIDGLGGALTLQAPLCVLGFGAGAFTLWRLQPARRTFATRLVAAWLCGLALVWFAYAVALGVGPATVEIAGVRPLELLLSYNSHLDLLLGLGLGIGLLMVLLQDQDRESAEQEARIAALELRLAQAKRLESIGVLVSGVAHELATPLTAILGYTDQRRGHPPVEAPDMTMRIVHDQAQRCRSIVDNLLGFVGSREERWEDLELRAVCRRVIEGLLAEAHSRGIAVELAPGAVVAMRGDAIGLEQVVTNLVHNAIQAADRNGHVRVFARTEGDQAELSVEDDGPGIPPDAMPRIFEPFFTTRAAAGGSGLGLSITHGIVRAHAGSLHAENLPPPARGARFTARLPLLSRGPSLSTPWPRISSRSGAPSWPPSHRPPSQVGPTREPTGPDEVLPVRELRPQLPRIGSKSRRMCVIEDDAAVLVLLHAVFDREGWQVEAYGNARAALEALREGADWSVIVSDVQMPHLSGPQLYAILQRERPELLSRLVFVTGDLGLPELAPLRTYGECRILPKPLDLQQLLEVCAQRCEA
jgi:signal transduction histidine kinase